MIRGVLTLASFATLSLALAACGGGGSGSATPLQNSTTPTSPTNPSSASKATATIAFQIPVIPANNVGTSSAAHMPLGTRNPKDLSPATDKISFIVDGTSVFKDVEVAKYNNANGGAGVFPFGNGQSITLAFGQQATYFTVTLALSVVPGRHTFGVVLKSGTPAFVLSEGQNTYTLNPGSNDLSSNPLALRGVIASGYISCDTEAQNTSTTPSTCNNYANFTPAAPPAFGGTYAFTAVAADYDGFPIPFQVVGGNPFSFDNGGFSVTETDGGSIVSITSTGAPWVNPGNHLAGTVVGDWSGASAAGNVMYGQPFSVTCNKTGTATLALTLSNPGNVFLSQPTGTPDGTTADYAPTSVDGSTLPRGNNGAGGPARVNNVTINCTSTGTITVI